MARQAPCVLVVEDEGAQREVLKYNLESEGFSVVMAENGDEAMLLAAGGIALVVPTLTNATLSSVGSSRSGVASGMLNSARQIGGLLGVALFGSWVSDLAPEVFEQGMRMSIGTSAVLLLLASAGCWFGMRRTGEAAVGVQVSPFE